MRDPYRSQVCMHCTRPRGNEALLCTPCGDDLAERVALDLISSIRQHGTSNASHPANAYHWQRWVHLNIRADPPVITHRQSIATIERLQNPPPHPED